MTGFVVAEDAITGQLLHVNTKAFLRGMVRGVDPQVGLVVKSDQGEVMAVLSLNPTDAHVLSEYMRQEAELASVIQQENEES